MQHCLGLTEVRQQALFFFHGPMKMYYANLLWVKAQMRQQAQPGSGGKPGESSFGMFSAR